jgi:proteasome assembly chaperone (PAC2) family protein
LDDVILEPRGDYRDPVVLVAFSGWPNAADAATRALRHLATSLAGERIGEIRLDDYCDCTVVRPVVTIKDGLVENLQIPATELVGCRPPRGERDLILASGPEPHFRWRQYGDQLLDIAQQLGASEVISLGALYDAVPHTRPTRVSGVTNRAELIDRLVGLDIARSSYSGPSSFHTTLLRLGADRDITGHSFWGHAPSYAQVEWNPAVSRALLVKLGEHLDLDFPLGSFKRPVERFVDALDRLTHMNAELRQLIRRLEEDYDRSAGPAEPLGPLSEGVLREIEDILRKGHDEPGP